MISKFGKNLHGKTIAVYGASSSIGKIFTQEAVKRGATIIAIARHINKIPSYSKQEIAGNIEVLQADITQKQAVRKILLNRKVEITINFAASFSTDPSKAKAVNVLGEQYILDASIEFGVKRHIYISTIATQILKHTPYRDTKLQAEKIVKLAGKKLDWIILRYANVLGTKTWNQPFKIIFPYLRMAIPKVPTDAKNAAFPYVTIETAVETALAAIDARPNQTITVLDGETTIGEYLSIMEKIYDIKWSFLPSQLLQFLDRYLGKYFPGVTNIFAAVEFLAHPPMFENKTMKQELQVRTKHFQDWVKTHFFKA